MPARLHSRRRSSGRLSAPVDVDSVKKVKQFESLIGPVLVFVYADWCGHCQRYKPMWKELENDPNRSLNMAAVRDDMFSKTSLTQRAKPVTSYPTVMLINEKGEAVNFKGANAADSQSVPDHNNMETMRAIVRNAGTPNGTQILSEDPTYIPQGKTVDISTNEQTPPSVNNSNSTRSGPSGPTISPPNIAADMILSTEKKVGGSGSGSGSLFDVLIRTAYRGTQRRKRRTKTKKTKASKTRSRR